MGDQIRNLVALCPETKRGTRWNGCWVDSRACLDISEKSPFSLALVEPVRTAPSLLPSMPHNGLLVHETSPILVKN
jgi:hypothetical protein